MIVAVYEPGTLGAVKEIDGSLPSMQDIVGGYIEQVPFRDKLVILCNEDGIMRRLPVNRMGLRGTFFVTRVKGENYVTLTNADLAYCAATFGLQ